MLQATEIHELIAKPDHIDERLKVVLTQTKGEIATQTEGGRSFV